MKERIKNLYKITLLTITMFVLQACGGGSEEPTAKFNISADTTTISFSNEFRQESNDSFTIKVNFEGNGLLVGYAPDSQAVGWLNYRTEDVTSSSATIHVDVVNAQNFRPELLETKIRLTTGDVDNLALVHHDIDVSLLIWELTTNVDTLVFNGTFGEQSIQDQLLSITSETNSWQASVDADWLSLDINEGEGNGEISISANITNFEEPALYRANLTLKETTTGDTKVIPVEVGLDNLYLFSDVGALLFSQTADSKSTKRALTVNHNSPTEIEWQASSDQTWLTITKNDKIVNVDLDVTQIGAGELSAANITIAATNNDNVIDLVIPVTFFNSPESNEPILLDELVTNNNAFINSPNMPYTYVGINNELHIYHQYTGTLVNSLVVSPENTLLDQFVIHPKGDFILARAIEEVVDEANQTTTQEIHRYKITLADLKATELVDTDIELEPIDYIHVAGRYLVVTQALELADENLKQLYFDRENFFSTNTVDQATITGSLWALDSAEALLKRYSVDVNDFTSNKATLSKTHEYRPELLPEDGTISNFIVENTELGLYTVSATSEWISFDGETFTDNGLLEQVEGSTTLGLTKSITGEALYTRFNNAQGFVIDIYNQNQELSNTIQTFGPLPTEISPSADNSRLAINAQTSDQIQFIDLHSFALSQSTVEFTTTFENSTIGLEEITLTGVNSGWIANTTADWLEVTMNSNNDLSSISLSINIDKIDSWGLFTTTVEIFDPQINSSRLIPVSVAVDAIRLASSYPALQFNQLSTKHQLHHTVDILNNSEGSIAWQATSSESWLSLSANGDKLEITALPNMVAGEETYYADIVLSAAENGAALPGVIKVAFNKAATDASEVILSDISINSSGLVLDPLRPILYIASGDKIDVINIFDGTEIASIQSPLMDVDLTNLVIHPDGSILLASNLETYIDDNNESQTRVNHYKVDLNTLDIEQIQSTNKTINYRPEKIVMVSGMPVVVSQGMELANLALETQYWNTDNLVETSQITDIKTSNLVYAVNASANALVQYDLNYNAFAGSSIIANLKNQFENTNYSSGVGAIAANGDGSNIYTANLTSEWSTLSNGSLDDQGTLHNSNILSSLNVITDSADNIYYYRFDFDFGYTISKYDNSQQFLWGAIFSNGANQVLVSPSYQRIISFNNLTGEMVIDTLP